jgi:hypothetical protein
MVLLQTTPKQPNHSPPSERIENEGVLPRSYPIAPALGLTQASAKRYAPRMRLRLLETSGLHMFVMDWNYYHAQPDPTVGLRR